IAGACARAPKLVLVLAGVAFLVFGSLGGLVSERLSAGGFLDPDAESSQVADLLAAEHGVANMQLIFAVRDPEGVAGQRARGAAGEIATALRGDERVSTVTSYRSEERRVGKSVDLGGRRIIKNKKERWRSQDA